MLKPHFGKIAVVLLATSLVSLLHFTIVSSPNSVYLGDERDGFKNYYTLIYHIKHDSTYSHFEGMNYPYGEHVVFTDNQPLLSNSIKFISNHIIDISDYTTGILNLFMLFSIVLTCYIIYLLFRRFKVPDVWAVLFAIGVGFMAPQIHRMTGHYALSYGFVIPLLMLLWVRFRDQQRLVNSVIIGVVVLGSALLHMYYFALSAFFLVGYWAITNMVKRTKEHFIFTLKHLVLQVFLPFIILQLWFYITDGVNDRPSNPYGFLAYRAHWQGIFLPITYPLGNFIHSIKALPQIEWEGISYIGIIPGLLCARYFVMVIWKFISSKGKKYLPISTDRTLNYLFLASFCVLLFSYGYPFKLNLEFLLEYAGPLKQFRSIGRFAWVFYYGANIAAFIVLYNIINSLRAHKTTKTILLCLSVAVLFYEAHIYQNHSSFYKLNEISELKSANAETYRQHPILNVNTDLYQAILPLPYYHSGSENITAQDKGAIVKNTMVASILTGMPLCAVNMSRTSLSQTLNNFRLILEPYGPYDIIEDYPSSKPLLLWIEKSETIRKDEQTLAANAKTVFEDNNVRLAELEIQKLYDILNGHYIRAREDAKDTTLYQVNGFLTRDSLPNFYHEFSVENNKIEDWLTAATSGNIKNKNVIFDSILPLQDTIDYTMSLWVKFHEDLLPTARIFFDEINEEGEIVFGESWSFGELVALLDYDWALIEYKFKPLSKSNKLRFTVTKETDQDLIVFWNNLLIRPSDNDIYYLRENDIVFKNGRTYGPDFFAMPMN